MVKDNQYKQIIQLWKNERRTIELLEVNAGMYSTIRQRITALEKELEINKSEDKVSIKIISERVERLNKVLRDITKVRTHKIIHAILNGTLNKKGLAAEELDLVVSLERVFDQHNKRSIFGESSIEISSEGIIDKSKATTANELHFMTVRILEDIPAIVDVSAKDKTSKSLGPYKKEDIVKLPLMYAKALIMKNAADRVELPDL
ncbi:MAG: hypothetical protein JXA54_04725 [Candidatus Heimdallarchaeota archaeon]|nr:hypothetical protein [Candidatus Heimdallarchaeota archaeon]